MEETRELAALVMSRASQKKHQAILSDWSGRHVRLKYQMCMSAIFVLLISNYEIEQINIFGIVKFADNPSQKTSLIFAFLFFLFSLASFFARTLNENIHLTEIGKKSLNKMNSLQSSIEEIADIFGSLDGSLLKQSIEKTLGEKNSLNNILTVIKNIEKKNPKSTLHLEGELASLKHDLKQLNSIISNLNENDEVANNPAYQTVVSRQEVILRRLGEYVDFPNTVKKIRTYAMQIDENVELFSSRISETAAEELTNTIAGLKTELAEIVKELKAVKRQIKTLDFWHSTEKSFLSVILPIAFSIIVAVGSIPDGISIFTEIKK